mgnify:CR=1 FL=1
MFLIANNLKLGSEKPRHIAILLPDIESVRVKVVFHRHQSGGLLQISGASGLGTILMRSISAGLP